MSALLCSETFSPSLSDISLKDRGRKMPPDHFKSWLRYISLNFASQALPTTVNGKYAYTQEFGSLIQSFQDTVIAECVQKIAQKKKSHESWVWWCTSVSQAFGATYKTVCNTMSSLATGQVLEQTGPFVLPQQSKTRKQQQPKSCSFNSRWTKSTDAMFPW